MFLNICKYSGSFLVWFVIFENFGNVFAIRTLMFGGGLFSRTIIFVWSLYLFLDFEGIF